MGVIVELTLPADAFDLGRILGMEGETRVVLDSIVPLGDKPIPFFRVFEGRDSFEAAVASNDAVRDIRVVTSHNGEVLYALDWDIADEGFLQGIISQDGTISEATGTETSWAFELRFESHGSLTEFQEYCQGENIPVEFERLYNPTKPDAGPWYGLTPAQRSALTRAVEAGYYKIPREISTKALAAEFDISDQAMTERLRRAVTNLVANSIQVSEEYTQKA